MYRFIILLMPLEQVNWKAFDFRRAAIFLISTFSYWMVKKPRIVWLMSVTTNIVFLVHWSRFGRWHQIGDDPPNPLDANFVPIVAMSSKNVRFGTKSSTGDGCSENAIFTYSFFFFSFLKFFGGKILKGKRGGGALFVKKNAISPSYTVLHKTLNTWF